MTIFVIFILFYQASVIGTNLEFSRTIEDFKTPDTHLTEPIIKKVNELLTSTPPAITANHGQLDNDKVRFYIEGGGIWFTDEGVWIEVKEETSKNRPESRVKGRESDERFEPMKELEPPEPVENKRVLLKQEFMGANMDRPVGRERLGGNSNFFYGNDSSKWHTEVPNYREVYYENLYDGIDLRYYTNNKGLKYDFIVHPGANVRDIKINYKGARVTSDGVNLYLQTPIGSVTDGELFVYQLIENKRVPVESRIIVENDIVQYDAHYNPEHILIIDPLIYSTFIGGSKRDDCHSITVDPSQNVYITGMTQSSNFPNTTGAFNTSKMGNFDVFVSKITKNGSALVFSTYIGGSKRELGRDIAIDSNCNIFVTGETESSNFPITLKANDTTYNGNLDIFVLKLYENGSGLNYSTFVGGGDDETGFSIVIDSAGNAYITGETLSIDFPTTKGAYQESFKSKVDCFIVKINQSGESLVYSTYVGGTDEDHGYAIALDSTGNVTITGTTRSSNFPTTTGAYNNSHGGYLDIYVFKLNQNGTRVIYSTLIGGTGFESAYGIVTTSDGSAIITGHTSSSTFPNTTGAFDRSYNGVGDAYVLKLNENGSKINFSTFIGGTRPEAALDIEIDANEDIYLTGTTQSKDFPLTLDALDTSYDLLDGFFIVMNSNATVLLYSTFIGGNDTEYNQKVAVDLKGNMYLSGSTRSANFTNTTGAYDITHNGESDGYVVKLCFNTTLKIESVELLMNMVPTNKIYSRLCPYTFRVQIFDPSKIMYFGTLTLSLDPFGTDLQLNWNGTMGQFSKSNDYNNYVSLHPSSSTYQYVSKRWILDFNAIFNWTYPDEDLHGVQVFTNVTNIPTEWLNVTGMYRVENDLVFKGKLSVNGEDDRIINYGDLVRGGEVLNWTGLTPIYENTTETYPPDDEFNITIWDELGNKKEDSPASGESFTLVTFTPFNTDTLGFYYQINISGIPPKCDATNEIFKIKIDGDNVTFSEPIPDNTTWQTISNVRVGVTITDHGGGDVDGGSVMRMVSTDNGTTWCEWEPVSGLDTDKSIKAQDLIYLDEGRDNLIKWQARDTLGNGPTESEQYLILVDTQNVTFSNPKPLASEVFLIDKVEVGISISDQTSGVNASSIEYSISLDEGTTWGAWKLITGIEDGMSIDLNLILTFKNGTGNRIKWRASDIAGNGPTESGIYTININLWKNKLLPKVELQLPEDGVSLETKSVELLWVLVNKELSNVTYDVYLDTIYPPIRLKKSNLTNTSLTINNLSNGETYYWEVLPKVGIDRGYCLSGVWSFNVDIPIPTVRLISPANNSTISTPIPTLSWSVIYVGTEMLSYNIHLGTDKKPEVVTKGYEITNYYPPFLLEDNQTYYWQVVPIVGDITGPTSEIWSFSVEAMHMPTFNLRLEIIPPIVELNPGENTTAKARVTNLGDFKDNITLVIDVPVDAGVVGKVIGPTFMNAEPDESVEFIIGITVVLEAQSGEIVITAEAISGIAQEYGLEVKRNSALTVKILEVTNQEVHNEPPEKGKDSIFIQLIFIIIIVIIIAILFLFILNRKQTKAAEEQITDHAQVYHLESAQPSTKTPSVQVPVQALELKRPSIIITAPIAKPVQRPLAETTSNPTPSATPQPITEAQPSKPPQTPIAQPTVVTQVPVPPPPNLQTTLRRRQNQLSSQPQVISTLTKTNNKLSKLVILGFGIFLVVLVHICSI